jgi:nucleoside-specific outer membrane channel protein Tsx
MKTKLTLMSLVAGLALAAPSTRAAEWSDTSIHYWFGTTFREPANPSKVTKNIFSLTHVSGYKYGSNFVNIDFLYSSKSDNVQGQDAVPTGATEVYAVYRHTLSFSKISGSKIAFGPIRDVGLELGIDLNTKNNAFASKKVMPIGGLNLAFDVPGFLNLGILVDKEWNDNAISFPGKVGNTVTFDPSLTVSLAWGVPVYGPLSFEGFANLITPKGKDGFGSKTVTEILAHPKLMADVATLWGSKGVQVGVGFQYWLNKFGNDHTKDDSGGSYEKAAFVEAAVHL